MKTPLSFVQHPASVGETYLEHLVSAGGFGLRMMFGGLACVLHALVPFLFVKTGSDCVIRLNAQMTRRRSAAAGQPPLAAHAGHR